MLWDLDMHPIFHTNVGYDTSQHYAVVVCLSVRLSVTRRYCTKTAKDKVMQTTLYDSPGIDSIVFCEIPTGSNRDGIGYNQIGT